MDITTRNGHHVGQTGRRHWWTRKAAAPSDHGSISSEGCVYTEAHRYGNHVREIRWGRASPTDYSAIVSQCEFGGPGSNRHHIRHAWWDIRLAIAAVTPGNDLSVGLKRQCIIVSSRNCNHV